MEGMMVVHFKLRPGPQSVYPVSREAVEEIIGRRRPWFQGRRLRGDDAHFAVCPYCDNPIQLKALYRRGPNSPRPYGMHVGKQVEGFLFDEERHEFCPYLMPRRPASKSSLRSSSQFGRKLIDLAIGQFDRIVLILAEDLGFWPSDNLSARMLRQWLVSRGYDYTGAHLRNLPWMIAYFSPSENLFGQRVARNKRLAQNIREMVPQAGFDRAGRLAEGTAWYRIDMQFLHHRSEILEDGTLHEELRIRIQDFSRTNEPASAATIHDQKIVFQPERFERLLNLPDNHPKRNQRLLNLARRVLQEVTL